MVSKYVAAGVKAVSPEASQIVQQKLENNVWANTSRTNPNAEKLRDGAIQRDSVRVPEPEMKYTHLNPNKIGAYKRPEHNVKCSTTAMRHMAPWDMQKDRHKIARIYMPQRKHVHCHPSNKLPGKYWVIDFGTDGMYKCPLMGWTTASADVMSNVHIKFGKLQDAVNHAEAHGWGYDVTYPTN